MRTRGRGRKNVKGQLLALVVMGQRWRGVQLGRGRCLEGRRGRLRFDLSFLDTKGQILNIRRSRDGIGFYAWGRETT